MGRHSAPSVASEHHPFIDEASPITDPRLFDRARPMAPAQVVPLPSAAAPSNPVQIAPVHTGRPMIDRRPAADPAPQLRPRPRVAVIDDDALADDFEVVGLPFQPRSVRGTLPRPESQIVPQVAGASLLGLRLQEARPMRPQDQRYARTGPIPIVAPDQPARTPIAFTRKREAALAAAALAVVGAMSGAAALLPSAASDAQAASKLDPITSPMPTASGGTGQTCLSPVQLKRAMRFHHHRRQLAAAPAAASALSANPDPSMSTDPSASPGSSTSTDPTSTPSQSATPTGSSSSTPTSGGISLPSVLSNLLAGLFTFSDFSTQSSGRLVSNGVLKGAGVGKTIVEMTPNTSTKAGSVPGNGNNQGGLSNPTNPLWLLSGVKDLEDVTVQGTEQGHLYNGVNMTGANLVIRNAEINDIPGNSNANPGETFAVGINRATGTGTVDDLTINGGTGALASAAGLAINNSDADWNISDLTTRNLKYSAGIALWQVRGTMNIRNYVQSGGARSLGAERMGGTVNLYDPVWAAGTTGHDVTYTWDGGYSGGSISFYYSSAAKVPDRKIQIITNKASGIAGSVHVYIGGVEQTASKYVTVN